jgi:hypothetical protein
MAVPDFAGTLGGNLYGTDGETSVTLGGELTPDQVFGNNESFSIDPDLDFSFGYSPSSYNSWSLGETGSGGFLNSGAGTQIPSAFETFFEENPFGKALKFGFGLTPAGKAFNLGKGIVNFAQNPTVGGGVSLASRALGGLPGAALNAGYQGFGQGNWGPAAGTVAANLVGRATGSGDLATLAGQFANNAVRGGLGVPSAGGGEMAEQPGVPGGGPTGGGFNMDMDLGSIIQAGMGLYGASQAGKGLSQASGMNSAVQAEIAKLSDMFSPTGAYANHMREVLARKDAAAGRNSQYGPREAQLMALLADKQAQASQTIGSLANTGQSNALSLQKQKDQLLGQRLGLLTNLGRSSGLFNMFSRTPGINPNAAGPDLAMQYSFGGPSTGVYGVGSSSAPSVDEDWMYGP